MSDQCSVPIVELGGLASGNEYQFRVCSGISVPATLLASCGVRVGAETPEFFRIFESVGAECTAVPLANIQGLSIRELTDSAVAFEWEGVVGATEYLVERRRPQDDSVEVLESVRECSFRSLPGQ